MDLNINNGLSFGKTAAMTCELKERKTNIKHSATLYEMNPKDKDDQDEIMNSRAGQVFGGDFLMAKYASMPYNKFYTLQDDKGEIVSFAETSRHLNPDNSKNGGTYTLINAFGSQKEKYADTETPMLAQIVKDAKEHSDKRIATAFRREDVPALKNAGFNKTEDDIWVLYKSGYDNLFDRAQERGENINFLS